MNIKIQNKELVYQNYLNSYKKYKYWLSIFYFVSFIILLIISSSTVWNKLPQYSKLQKNLDFYNIMSIKYNINSTTLIKDIFHDKIKMMPPTIESWADMKKNAHNYYGIKNVTTFFDTLYKDINCLKFINYIHYKRDSLKAVIDTIEAKTITPDSLVTKYEQIFIKIKDSKISVEQRILQEKENFVSEIDTLIQVNTLIIPFEIIQYLLLDYKISNDYYDKSLAFLYEEVSTQMDSINNYLNKPLLNLPNVNIPLTLKYAKNVTFIIHMVISLHLIVLFLNFKYLENEIKKMNDKKILCPSITNILQNLEILILPQKCIIYFSFFLNLILPILITLYIGLKIKPIIIWSLFYIPIFIYIILLGLILISIIKPKYFKFLRKYV